MDIEGGEYLPASSFLSTDTVLADVVLLCGPPWTEPYTPEEVNIIWQQLLSNNRGRIFYGPLFMHLDLPEATGMRKCKF